MREIEREREKDKRRRVRERERGKRESIQNLNYGVRINANDDLSTSLNESKRSGSGGACSRHALVSGCVGLSLDTLAQKLKVRRGAAVS